jgi:hypothetical protein
MNWHDDEKSGAPVDLLPEAIKQSRYRDGLPP